jgi:hypothetical protein
VTARRVVCKVCGEEWDLDMDPPRCTCESPDDDAWSLYEEQEEKCD